MGHETARSKQLRDWIRNGQIVCMCLDREVHHHRYTEPRCPWGDAIEEIYREEDELDRLTAAQTASKL
jgi:hypothetical protein